MAILFWIILVIFLILVWLTTDYILGGKNHRKTIKEITFSEKYGEIHLLTDGAKLMKALLSDIQNATQYVHIQFYIVKNDDIGIKFLSLLKKKAKEFRLWFLIVIPVNVRL